jgi:urea transport system substrate-binding protein
VTLEARLVDPLEAALLPRSGDPLRVALVVPQSGPLGMVGPSAVEAALLAAHELNTVGGVGGRYVELVLVDGGRSPADVAREVQGLCVVGGVDVVTGLHTSDVHRALEATVTGRTPYVFTPPHEGGRRRAGVVCTGTDPARQLGGAVGHLTRNRRLQAWALVGNDYIWPRAVHRVARRLVHRAGARVVLERLVPLGRIAPRVERIVDDLRRSGADAVLLSLVGRDLVELNAALRQAGLDRRLVRLSGSLEENGLLALGGDRTGTLFSSMPSFASLRSDRRLGLDERYHALFGPDAPVLDTYAEGVYDGLHLVARLAEADWLNPTDLASGSARLLAEEHGGGVHLACADGLDLAVVASA